MATNRYLIKPEAEAWVLEHNGHEIARFESRQLALEEASRRAKDEAAEIVTVDGEGFFVDHERYGTRGGGGPVG